MNDEAMRLFAPKEKKFMTVGELIEQLSKIDRKRKVRLLIEQDDAMGNLVEVLTEISSVIPDDVTAKCEEEFVTIIYGDTVCTI